MKPVFTIIGIGGAIQLFSGEKGGGYLTEDLALAEKAAANFAAKGTAGGYFVMKAVQHFGPVTPKVEITKID